MIFWKTKGRSYWKDEISDEYLLNIVSCLEQGKFSDRYITPEMIDNIFEECFARGILDAETAHKKSSLCIDKFYEKEELRERYEMDAALDSDRFYGDDD